MKFEEVAKPQSCKALLDVSLTKRKTLQISRTCKLLRRIPKPLLRWAFLRVAVPTLPQVPPRSAALPIDVVVQNDLEDTGARLKMLSGSRSSGSNLLNIGDTTKGTMDNTDTPRPSLSMRRVSLRSRCCHGRSPLFPVLSTAHAPGRAPCAPARGARTPRRRSRASCPPRPWTPGRALHVLEV